MDPKPMYLNEAVDPYSGFVDEGAEEYRRYLAGPYRLHRIQNKLPWDDHFRRMDDERERVIENVLDVNSMTRNTMNILFVGPGLKPAGGYLVHPAGSGMYNGEISNQSCETSLQHMNAMIIADISQEVARQAVENLVEVGGINPSVLMPAQLDITRGRAAIYEMQLRKWAGRVKNIDDLQALAEKLRTYNVDRLDEKLFVAVQDYQRRTKDTSLPPPMIPGGLNRNRSMRYSVRKSEDDDESAQLPIHLGIFSMVTAGTGSPPEWKYLWSTLDRLTGEPEHLQDSGILQIRRETRMAFHEWISRYNTYVTIESARSFFIDNMNGSLQPTLLVITDDDTRYQGSENGTPIGLHPRLNCSEVQRELAGVSKPIPTGMPAIETVVNDLGYWGDEESDSADTRSHGHGIKSMVMRPKPQRGLRKKRKVNAADGVSPDDQIVP